VAIIFLSSQVERPTFKSITTQMEKKKSPIEVNSKFRIPATNIRKNLNPAKGRKDLILGTRGANIELKN